MTENGHQLVLVRTFECDNLPLRRTGPNIGTPEYDKELDIIIQRATLTIYHKTGGEVLVLFKDEDDCNDILQFQDNRLYRHQITTSENDDVNKIHISVFINVKQLELWLQQGISIPSRFELMENLQQYFEEGTPPITRKELCETIRVPNPAPELVGEYQSPENNELFEFQKRKVQWMRFIENQIIAGGVSFEEPSAPTLMEISPLVTVDFTRKTFVPTGTTAPASVARVFRGGCLFDDCGLGKTFTTISRCMQDRLSNGTTAATLIICPAETHQHWKDVINHIDPLAVVEVFLNKRALTKLTTRRVAATDYVIVTYALAKLTVKCINQAFGNSSCREVNEVDNLYWVLLTERAFKTTSDRYHSLPFHQYRWRRTILDEGDLTFDSYEIVGFVRNLCTDFVWILAGAVDNIWWAQYDYIYLTNILTSSGRRGYTNGNTYNELCKPTLDCLRRFVELLCTRDTKETIKREITFPEPVQQIIMLELNAEERACYDLMQYNDVRTMANLCMRPPDTAESRVVSTKEEAVCILQLKHSEKEKALQETITNLGITIESPASQLCELLHEQARMELETASSKLQTLIRTRAYVNTSLNTGEGSFVCSVCLGTPSADESLCMTPCGHVFCWACEHTWVRQNRQCSSCREPTEVKEIIHIRPKLEGISDELRENIETHGTKLAYFIDYLKRHENEKIVVFVTNDARSLVISSALEYQGIKFKRCLGSADERAKSIAAFTNAHSRINVFLLSPSYMCRGASLEVCRKVIFIDQFYTDRQARTTLEDMCLARVQPLTKPRKIEIIRFVLKGTIEEELYKEFSGCG